MYIAPTLKPICMKRYSFQPTGHCSYELYDLRDVKKFTRPLARELNEPIYIICDNGAGTSFTEYTMHPNGSFTREGVNLSFNN